MRRATSSCKNPARPPTPRGTFALRSPVRPNPIGLHVCAVLAIDPGNGVITVDGIDVLDGTPVIDIKPYFASTDAIPAASSPERG
jgi:tRNA (Thr-GGU) A37 N-methylase